MESTQVQLHQTLSPLYLWREAEFRLPAYNEFTVGISSTKLDLEWRLFLERLFDHEYLFNVISLKSKVPRKREH